MIMIMNEGDGCYFWLSNPFPDGFTAPIPQFHFAVRIDLSPRKFKICTNYTVPGYGFDELVDDYWIGG